MGISRTIEADKEIQQECILFWLDFDEKIDDFVKIFEKVKLFQRIFTMAETMGPGKIAYTLQQEGIKNI